MAEVLPAVNSPKSSTRTAAGQSCREFRSRHFAAAARRNGYSIARRCVSELAERRMRHLGETNGDILLGLEQLGRREDRPKARP
jgi:hypothetical protein